MGERILARTKGRTGIPQLLDVYLLRSFIYYFMLLTVGFIVLFEVFTFFELLDDMAQHRTGLVEVGLYFVYLACYLFYQLAPLAALVSVLVTLGVMTKNNELVAFKASGLSLYRIALPLLLAGIFLAASLLVLDDTYLPYANQRQDASAQPDQGPPGADLLPAQPPVDFWRERENLQLRTLRSRSRIIRRPERIRARSRNI